MLDTENDTLIKLVQLDDETPLKLIDTALDNDDDEILNCSSAEEEDDD